MYSDFPILIPGRSTGPASFVRRHQKILVCLVLDDESGINHGLFYKEFFREKIYPLRSLYFTSFFHFLS